MAASEFRGSAQRGGGGDPLIGQVINDRFRIISMIARGGMGRVYRAEQVPLGRLVAIKTLDPREGGVQSDPQFQQRFFLEASIASKLQHPNTVTIFDYGRTAEGQYFIAMELVDGLGLNRTVREVGRLPPGRVIHIAMQIARSLREAHRLDVIHRDLKPANILLTRHGDEDDFVKVLDFGLVKRVEGDHQEQLTRAGLFVGSPKYMAPEQIRGERVDARADIYALGVCMYEMLTGRVPFDSDNAVSVLMAHIHEPVPAITDPTVPRPLSDLVARCLAKAVDERPASMDEVIVSLKQASGDKGLSLSGAYPSSGDLHLGNTSGMLRVAPSQPREPLATSGAGLPGASLEPKAAVAAYGAGPSETPRLTASSIARPPPRETSFWPKLAVLVSLLVMAGVLGLRFVGDTQEPTGGPIAQPLQTAPTQTTPRLRSGEPRVEPLQQATVVLTLTSIPAGARVHVDNRLAGRTPTKVELRGEQASLGRELELRFELEGHEPASAFRIVRGPTMSVEVVLPASAEVR